MLASELKIGHSVELEVQMDDKKTTLFTSIEMHRENNILLLKTFRYNGKIIGFPTSCSVTLVYAEGSLAYYWENVTVKPVRYEGEIYHCVHLVGNSRVMNRRNSYRVYFGTEMILSAPTASGQKSHKVLVRDISETGMSFYSQENFTVGKNVRLYLSVAPGKEISIRSQILRSQAGSHRNGSIYGCKFTEPNPILNNYLMRYQQERQAKRIGRKRT